MELVREIDSSSHQLDQVLSEDTEITTTPAGEGTWQPSGLAYSPRIHSTQETHPAENRVEDIKYVEVPQKEFPLPKKYKNIFLFTLENSIVVFLSLLFGVYVTNQLTKAVTETNQKKCKLTFFDTNVIQNKGDKSSKEERNWPTFEPPENAAYSFAAAPVKPEDCKLLPELQRAEAYWSAANERMKFIISEDDIREDLEEEVVNLSDMAQEREGVEATELNPVVVSDVNGWTSEVLGGLIKEEGNAALEHMSFTVCEASTDESYYSLEKQIDEMSDSLYCTIITKFPDIHTIMLTHSNVPPGAYTAEDPTEPRIYGLLSNLGSESHLPEAEVKKLITGSLKLYRDVNVNLRALPHPMRNIIITPDYSLKLTPGGLRPKGTWEYSVGEVASGQKEADCIQALMDQLNGLRWNFQAALLGRDGDFGIPVAFRDLPEKVNQPALLTSEAAEFFRFWHESQINKFEDIQLLLDHPYLTDNSEKNH